MFISLLLKNLLQLFITLLRLEKASGFLGKFQLNFATRHIEVVVIMATMAAKLRLTFIDSMANSVTTPAKLAEA